MKHQDFPRRGFLAGMVAAVLTSGVAGPGLAQAAARGRAPVPDEDWLKKLNGRHRQAFDVTSLGEGKVLSQVRNFLDGYRDAYGVSDSEVSAAVVIHGSALALVFDDATWARFRLGERFGVEDAGTKKASVRNLFAAPRPGDPIPAEASVPALQRRGVAFVLCNNTLKRVTGELARAVGRSPESVREELLGGLLPGVTLVPAAVVALNRAQEHGLTYVYAG